MHLWTSILRSVLPVPCFDRPFVCEGFPSASQVLVVGENPATDLSVDWWSFWRPELGFNYDAFFAYYVEQRAVRGKGISNTRRRLERFRSNGVRCVETNVFQNQRLGGAGSGVSNHAIFELLAENMPDLRAIVAHGKVAHQLLEGAKLPHGIECYRTRHFRTESYGVIDRICAAIRDA